MAIFEINKYRTPNINTVDMKETLQNFEIFMSVYSAAREKVGKNRMPKMTQSFSPVSATPSREYDGDAERFVIEREEFMPEYKELHSLFTQGYLRISNPLKEGATDRRRQLFMLRYVYGLNVTKIMERTLLSKTFIIDESRAGFLQFCQVLGIVILKEETKPLIKEITKQFESLYPKKSYLDI